MKNYLKKLFLKIYSLFKDIYTHLFLVYFLLRFCFVLIVINYIPGDFLYATRLVQPHCAIAGFHPIFLSISNGGQDELAVCKHKVNFVFYST